MSADDSQSKDEDAPHSVSPEVNSPLPLCNLVLLSVPLDLSLGNGGQEGTSLSSPDRAPPARLHLPRRPGAPASTTAERACRRPFLDGYVTREIHHPPLHSLQPFLESAFLDSNLVRGGLHVGFPSTSASADQSLRFGDKSHSSVRCRHCAGGISRSGFRPCAKRLNAERPVSAAPLQAVFRRSSPQARRA